jgi:hypothetical protein
MVNSTLEITKDPFGSNKVNLPRAVHVETRLLDCISNVRPGECQVLKRAYKATVVCRISKRRTFISRYFGTCIHWSGTRFATTHAMAGQNVQSILTLGEE